jgi:hypothetical protein
MAPKNATGPADRRRLTPSSIEVRRLKSWIFSHQMPTAIPASATTASKISLSGDGRFSTNPPCRARFCAVKGTLGHSPRASTPVGLPLVSAPRSVPSPRNLAHVGLPFAAPPPSHHHGTTTSAGPTPPLGTMKKRYTDGHLSYCLTHIASRLKPTACRPRHCKKLFTTTPLGSVSPTP